MSKRDDGEQGSLSPDCRSSPPLTPSLSTTPSSQAPAPAAAAAAAQSNPTRIRASGGRNGPRSRQGCWTCRTKKVKCDETRPKCLRCIRLRLFCDYEPRGGGGGGGGGDKRSSPPGGGGGRDATAAGPGFPETHRALMASQPWLLQVAPWRRAAPMPMPMHMPAFDTAANSLKLTSLDHEAIRHYRTTFSQRHSTKNTDFSVYSIIFTLAERDPLVMRGLLALGTRNMHQGRVGAASPEEEEEEDRRGPARRWRPPPPPPLGGWSGLGHYSAALRMMADTISAGGDGVIDLDVALAAIYLMLMYEQKYGDAAYSGWTNHLRGAALLIQERCSDWPAQLARGRPTATTGVSSSSSSSSSSSLSPSSSPSSGNVATSSTTQRPPPPSPPLSVFAARMLVYFSVMDGFGATFGLGGDINKVMHRIAQAHDPDVVLTEAFTKLHRYSDGLYRAVFRQSYPAHEMLADVANQHITDMWQACCGLRYLVADISSSYEGDAARARLALVQESADHLAEKYPELVALATEMTPDADVPDMVATNFRAFMPLYFASLLEMHLLRCEMEPAGGGGGGGGAMTADEERTTTATYVAVIMNLAHQIYKHARLDLLHLITYPLFLVALQTDSGPTRDWILARFQDLTAFGPNIGRAHAFLRMALAKQAETGERVNVREELRTGKLPVFVI